MFLAQQKTLQNLFQTSRVAIIIKLRLIYIDHLIPIEIIPIKYRGAVYLFFRITLYQLKVGNLIQFHVREYPNTGPLISQLLEHFRNANLFLFPADDDIYFGRSGGLDESAVGIYWAPARVPEQGQGPLCMSPSS